MLLSWAAQRGTAFLTTSTKPQRILENFEVWTRRTSATTCLAPIRPDSYTTPLDATAAKPQVKLYLTDSREDANPWGFTNMLSRVMSYARTHCPLTNWAGSRRYDSASYENLANFRKPRLAFVVLVALDNGNPVIALFDCKLGSLCECVVERRCGIFGPNDPYT